MKKTTKRLLAAVLCLVMVLGALPLTALAEAGIAPMSLLPSDTAVGTYVFKNGETTVSTQRLKDGEELLEPATPSGATAADHFVGWKDTDGNAPTFDAASSVTGGATYTYNAQWEQAYYVYFMADVAGGTNENVVLATEKVAPGGKVASLPTDSSVASWNGFTTDTVVTEDTVVRPVLKEGYWVTFDSQGGTVVTSRFVGKNESLRLSDIETTRAGYTFDGWYDAATGGNKVTTLTGITSNTTLYAHWTPGQVKVSVVYWGENADDEDYSVMTSKTVDISIDAGRNEIEALKDIPDDATDANGETYKDHFTYEKMDEDVVINGDGSTVINIYYKRNRYTITFDGLGGYKLELTCKKEEHTHTYNESKRVGGWITGHNEYKGGCYGDTWSRYPECEKTEHEHDDYRCYTQVKDESSNTFTVTAKYDSDITSIWANDPIKPKLAEGKAFQSSITNRQYSYLEKMPAYDLTMTLYTYSGSTTYTWDYWLEMLPGSTTTKDTTTGSDGNTYFKHHTSTVKASGLHLTYEEDYYPITGFTQKYAKNDTGWNGGYLFADDNHANLYYTRSQFSLVKQNYGISTTENYLYEADISTEDTAPSQPTALTGTYTFEGWYIVEPAVVKAASATERERLKFDFTQPMPAKTLVLYSYWEPETVSLTISCNIIGTSQTFANSNCEYGTVISRTLAYEQADAAIKAAGLVVAYWADESGNSVDVNQGLSADMTIHPVYANATDSYHVYYKNADDTDYATDNYTYQSGAAAEAMQPTDIDNFLYWQIGNDTTKYYPGTQINISNADVTLTAICGTTRGTTTLTYHSNFGEAEETYAVGNIAVNAEHEVLSYAETAMTSREGYTFLGWSTDASATAADTAYAPSTKIIVDDGIDTPTNDLYAIWAADITVTFVVKNGTWNGKSDTEAASFSVTIPYNTALTSIPAATAATGYDPVSGSWTGANGMPNTTTALTEHTTYTYTFGTQIKYKVTYKVDGTQVGNFDEYTYDTEVTVREKYVKDNYTVTDWTSTDVDISSGKFSMPARDVVITATSSINTANYTINYYLDDVFQESETGTANIGSKVDATKTGNYTGNILFPSTQVTYISSIAANTTAGQPEPNVLNLYYYTDEEGGDNGGNQYPDIYEKKVTFKIVNGTWDGNDYADKEVWVKLYKDGNASADGSGSLTTPTGMQPNSDYDPSSGVWDETPPTTVTGTDNATYTFTYSTVLAANLSVAKTVYKVGSTVVENQQSIPTAQAGDTVIWKIVVTNSGKVSGNFTLTDMLGTTPITTFYSDPDCAQTTTDFAVGTGDNNTATYYVKYDVTADAVVGSTLVNSVTVTGNNEPGVAPGVPVGGLTVEKDVTSVGNAFEAEIEYPVNPANERAAAAAPTTAKVGETITWTITVKNYFDTAQTFTLTDELTGNRDVTLGAPNGGTYADGKYTIPAAGKNADGSIKPTVMTITATYEVQASDEGKTLVNNVKVTPTDGTPIEDDAPGVEVEGKLGVSKYVYSITRNGEEIYKISDNTDVPEAKIGDKITWGITVSNTGKNAIRYTLADALKGETEPLTIYAENHEDEIGANGIQTIEAPAEGYVVSYVFYYVDYTVKTSDYGETLINVATVTEKNEDGGDSETHPAESNPVKVEDKPNTPSYNPNYNAGVQLEKGEHFNYVIGYSDGTVRPEGNITRAEVATIFFRLLTDESRKTYLTEYNTFTDVEKSMWHNVAISTLARAGVLNGYNDGSFRPDNNITRAEMAAIISRFAELEGSTRISFTDIKGHWAEKSILLAASNGWINGYNDGSFRPDQNITRAETFAMINRVLERKVEHVNDLVSDMNTWVDNMDTTQWYYFDVQEATNYHSYQRKYTNTNAEKWIKKLTDIDWTVYQY